MALLAGNWCRAMLIKIEQNFNKNAIKNYSTKNLIDIMQKKNNNNKCQCNGIKKGRIEWIHSSALIEWKKSISVNRFILFSACVTESMKCNNICILAGEFEYESLWVFDPHLPHRNALSKSNAWQSLVQWNVD